MQNRWLPAIAILGLLLGGCSVYKIDIVQGNVVTTDMTDKLKVGMTPAQVRYILGTPLVLDQMNLNRWDYVYRFKPGTYAQKAGMPKVEDRRLTVWFDKGLLARTELIDIPKSAPSLPTTKDKAIVGPAIGSTPGAYPGQPSQSPGQP